VLVFLRTLRKEMLYWYQIKTKKSKADFELSLKPRAAARCPMRKKAPTAIVR
jgi:hypothetical protein